MKCIFQLVDKESGVRSRAVTATRAQFARQLSERLGDQVDSFYVLVVCEHCDTEDMDFSCAPLMLASSFVRSFNPSEVVSHG